MLSPMPREVYYGGDVSKRPMAGDEYVQLDWDESSLTLYLRHGVFADEDSRKQKRLRFPTLKELNQALEKQREEASARGFKPYTLLYVEAEDTPLPDEDPN